MFHALSQLSNNLRDFGYDKPMLVIHNSGGMAQMNSTDALQTIHSGPIAGVGAAEHLSTETGLGHVISTDMGGTSFDIGLVPEGGVKHYDFLPTIDRWLVSVPMVHLDTLGAGGSYTELYAMDFAERFILMGHDGPFHLKIAQGRPILRGLGLYHGKRGYGVSVEAQVKHGPITILGQTQTRDGRLKWLVAEGWSLPGEILRIGNTNSRLRITPRAEDDFDVAAFHGGKESGITKQMAGNRIPISRQCQFPKFLLET